MSAYVCRVILNQVMFVHYLEIPHAQLQDTILTLVIVNANKSVAMR